MKQGDGRANRYELSKFSQQFGDTEIQKTLGGELC